MFYKSKKILVILAAGIGSRFGSGIKQLEPADRRTSIQRGPIREPIKEPLLLQQGIVDKLYINI